jgi:hypothetical protein
MRLTPPKNTACHMPVVLHLTNPASLMPRSSAVTSSPFSSGVPARRNPTTGIDRCCARAVSGQEW